MKSSLILVSLYVRDLPGMQVFYTEKLGLEVVPQLTGGGFVFLKPARGTPLALQEAAMLPPGAGTQPGASSLGFDVDDLEATYNDWKAAGVEVVSEIGDMGAGRVFYARDPEGNSIAITQLYDGVRAFRQQLGV